MDEFFYKSTLVEVSRTLVKVGSTSYPINGIGSVLVKPSNRNAWFIAAFIVAALGVAGGSGGGGLLFLAMLLAIAGLCSKGALVLRTSSGDQQALSHANIKLLEEVKAAIEKAVHMRG